MARKVAAGLRALVVPGSFAVKQQAEARGPRPGVLRGRASSGAAPAARMCLGMNPDILNPGDRSASTSNRNFEGRQGKGGRTHLVSPAVAAATAIAGHFTHPGGPARWNPSRVIEGTALPVDRSDVDTDQIIPAEYLKRIERTGFGPFLFAEWRKDPDFVINDPRYAGASILLAGANFGSGSSREHAPWAIEDAGFRAIIAPSFADIFRNNCTKVGLLPVELRMESVRALMDAVLDDPTTRIVVDLERRSVTAPDLDETFDIEDFTRVAAAGGPGRHRAHDAQAGRDRRVRITASVLVADGLAEPSSAPERRSASSRVEAVSATSASEYRTSTGVASRSSRAPSGRAIRSASNRRTHPLDRRRRSGPYAVAHHGFEQRLGSRHAGLVAKRQHIAVGPAPHLFASGRSRLAGGELQHRAPVEVDELVHRVHERCVGRYTHLRPDPERVQRRPFRYQIPDLELVQAAAREDADLREAGVIEQLPGAPRELQQIAAVQPDAEPTGELQLAERPRSPFATPCIVSYVSTRNVVRSG